MVINLTGKKTNLLKIIPCPEDGVMILLYA